MRSITSPPGGLVGSWRPAVIAQFTGMSRVRFTPWRLVIFCFFAPPSDDAGCDDDPGSGVGW